MRAYFDVDDINAAAVRVKELGGEAQEPHPVPGMGWAAVYTDPQGNDFGLWQNDPRSRLQPGRPGKPAGQEHGSEPV
jgi:predicted enzyme related to lactoylglutathione lyase